MRRETCSNRHTILRYRFWAAAAIITPLLFGVVPSAQAQAIGGHIGFVLPLVTDTNGQTTTLADGFAIGFPVGVTVKGKGRFAFDMEFVPQIKDSPRNVTLTFHPGGLWSIGGGFAVGIRAAFDVNSSQFGFTPLLHKSWPIGKEDGFFKAYFMEADLPVRFNRPPVGVATSPVTFAMHFDLGF